MSLRRKVMGGGLLTAVLLVASAAPAMAHDCFVVNRSTQGTMGATHSSQWGLVDINGFLSSCASPAQISVIDAALAQAGLPLITATRTDKLLKSNDHGILHIDDAYVPIVLANVDAATADCLNSQG